MQESLDPGTPAADLPGPPPGLATQEVRVVADPLGQPRVNELGLKFWLDAACMRYVQSKVDKDDKPLLSDVQVLLVEFADGTRTRPVTVRGEPEYEHTSLEAIAVHVDTLAVDRMFGTYDRMFGT